MANKTKLSIAASLVVLAGGVFATDLDGQSKTIIACVALAGAVLITILKKDDRSS